jgi:hypothetical protein
VPRLRPLATLSAGAALAALAPVADAAGADTAFGTRVLAGGAKGEDVRVLQELLTRAGIETPVDGRFGPATRRGVREWESRRPAAAPVLNGGAASRQIAGVVRRDGRLSRREARLLRSDVAAAEVGRTLSLPAQAATLGVDRAAVAPASAPEAVKRMIAAGNEIHGTPYRYGGGHARRPNRDSGYDCSGSMSYVMQGAGLLVDPLDSSGFARYGESGPGAWVTIYANASHSFMVIAGVRFDTSGRKDAGSRWQTRQRSSSGYSVRHPPGL